VLLSTAAQNVPSSGVCWLISLVSANLWSYLRDRSLRGAFEAAPARSLAGTATGYKVYNPIEDVRPLPEQLGHVYTSRVFDRVCVWLAVALRLVTLIALFLWMTTGTLDWSFFFFTALESEVDLLLVEGLRLYVMFIGAEAELLGVLWNLDVEPLPLTDAAWRSTTRDQFMAWHKGQKDYVLY
jgi:hypothetical protein